MESPRHRGRPHGQPQHTAADLQVFPLPDRPGVRAAGEVTLTTLTEWERALDQLVRRREGALYVELSAVTFIDVAGASALALAAQRLPADQHIHLDAPPFGLQRMFDMFWPDLLTIEMVAR
ncbi:STAS domain-containing protein [Streptomyces avermitilis]|uniref:STAS domain-containing protein n=1 Tax=Streptomyces avermitilis TaxID=33903 RepID=UPI00339E5D7C